MTTDELCHELSRDAFEIACAYKPVGLLEGLFGNLIEVVEREFSASESVADRADQIISIRTEQLSAQEAGV